MRGLCRSNTRSCPYRRLRSTIEHLLNAVGELMATLDDARRSVTSLGRPMSQTDRFPVVAPSHGLIDSLDAVSDFAHTPGGVCGEREITFHAKSPVAPSAATS